jgi:hypothetical protein
VNAEDIEISVSKYKPNADPIQHVATEHPLTQNIAEDALNQKWCAAQEE